MIRPCSRLNSTYIIDSIAFADPDAYADALALPEAFPAVYSGLSHWVNRVDRSPYITTTLTTPSSQNHIQAARQEDRYGGPSLLRRDASHDGRPHEVPFVKTAGGRERGRSSRRDLR